MNLTRVGFKPEDKSELFSSAAMILDQDQTDKHKGKVVGVVFFSGGGNVLYKHDPAIPDEALMVAGECFVGETLRTSRWKTFNVQVETPRKYPVVCLCGSTRFEEKTKQLAEELQIAGYIVLMVNSWTRKDVLHDPQAPEDQALKGKFDDIHKEKIRLADKVLVVDVDGYIGKSTQSEIDFAKSLGKPIVFLSDRESIKGVKT